MVFSRAQGDEYNPAMSTGWLAQAIAQNIRLPRPFPARSAGSLPQAIHRADTDEAFFRLQLLVHGPRRRERD